MAGQLGMDLGIGAGPGYPVPNLPVPAAALRSASPLCDARLPHRAASPMSPMRVGSFQHSVLPSPRPLIAEYPLHTGARAPSPMYRAESLAAPHAAPLQARAELDAASPPMPPFSPGAVEAFFRGHPTSAPRPRRALSPCPPPRVASPCPAPRLAV